MDQTERLHLEPWGAIAAAEQPDSLHEEVVVEDPEELDCDWEVPAVLRPCDHP